MKFLAAVLLSFLCYAQAEYRVALLIENKTYKNHALEYSADRIPQIAKELKSDGFEVHIWKDKEKKDFDKKFEELLSVVPVNSTLLIYYSGYLLSADYKGLSKNYLMMTDSDFKSEDDISRRGLQIDQIFSLLEKRCGSRDKIFYLDAVTKYPDEKFNKVQPMVSMTVPENIYVFSRLKPGEVKAQFSSGFSYRSGSGKSVLQKIKPLSSWSSLGEKPLPERDIAASRPLTDISEGKKAGDEWINELGMVFCWCPPGSYLMGSPKNSPGYEADQVQQEVTFKKGFWVSKYEMTNLQYYKIRKRENGMFKENLANHPVITNYDEKKHIIKYLQEKSPAPAGWAYDYPSESEWEYFARAGSTDRYFFGSDETKLPEYANFADKSLYDLQDGFYNYADRKLNDGVSMLAPVGLFKANAWGIHDVYGNVWEWCDTAYSRNRKQPAKEEKNGTVVKGGSWCSLKDYCHSAFRHSFEGRHDNNFIGLRLIIKQK